MWYCQVLDCLKITWRVLRYSLRHKASSRGFRNPLGTFACNSFILCARCASVEGSEIRCFCIQGARGRREPMATYRFSDKPGLAAFEDVTAASIRTLLRIFCKRIWYAGSEGSPSMRNHK